MNTKKTTKKRDITPLSVVICVLLTIYAISMILLLFYGVINSLKSNVDFLNGNKAFGWPRKKFSQQEIFGKNYLLIFQNFNIKVSTSFYTLFGKVSKNKEVGFLEMLWYTILYTGVGALLLAIVPMVVGYICAKYKNVLTKIVSAVALIILTLPIVGTETSMVTLMRNLGLYDNILGNWIQKFNFTGMYFFVYLAFFKGLSNTYSEAAEMDGASQLKIMLNINFPLAIKIFTSIFLLQFVSLWNDYQAPLLYLPTHPTLAYGIYALVMSDANRKLSKTPIKIAGCMSLALPILLIYVIFKDKLMGDVSLGGIKE